MPSSPLLPRRPEARTEKVEDLVERVRRGKVRVPRFQRGLKWKSSHVLELFDSIYRGFPVGALLFHKQPAPAARLTVGPLKVDAPEETAWWVVDGQQRVTTLFACLARELPLPVRADVEDPFVVYFDAEAQRFEASPQRGQPDAGWVPLPVLLDAARLTEWVFQWQHRSSQALRHAVFEAGARIREYAIPLYLIETSDKKVAEEIFYRVNKAGAPLAWTDVHKALFGGTDSVPSTLAELAELLVPVGMGRLDEGRLLTCLLAMRGKDPTRSLAEHYQRDPEVLQNAVREALPVLRRVLSFLRKDAGAPHLRLLPKSILLDVLVRYFAVNVDPSPRARLLLARWLWRLVLGAGRCDDRTLRRRGISAVGGDAEQSVQELLGLVSKDRPPPGELPAAFDPRADKSRVALLALAHLGPHDLVDERAIEVAGLIETSDKAAFVKIVKQSEVAGGRSPANRIIHPHGQPVVRLLRHRITTRGPGDAALASHGIDAVAAERLAAGDLEGFLARRIETLGDLVRRFGDRMASWEHNDRPSVAYLLERAEAEA